MEQLVVCGLPRLRVLCVCWCLRSFNMSPQAFDDASVVVPITTERFSARSGFDGNGRDDERVVTVVNWFLNQGPVALKP